MAPLIYYDTCSANVTGNVVATNSGSYAPCERNIWDDRIAQRNAANERARRNLLKIVGIRPARQSLFAPARFESRIPRFFRPAKRSRGACGIY